MKRILDGNLILNDIWIKGELSNFKLHYSGHIYATLKDSGGVLKAVMFKSAAAKLNFVPEDGMKVLARGRISVYEAGGAYQLYISEMIPDGVGDLYVAFEKLKKELAEEGLFDEKFKKPIPQYPETVGVITASTGAAVRDIINVITRRYPYAKILLYPALVQGSGAAASVCAGIELFNRLKNADVLIVGRGGGSIEDLWAFNEEPVARAIFASEIPVVSAVGHETDFTIADFVADLRAPTPSAAAELCVPSQTELISRIAADTLRMKNHMTKLLENLSLRAARFKLQNPEAKIDEFRQRADDALRRAAHAAEIVMMSKKRGLAENAAKLDALSPLKVMMRGFSVAVGEDGSVIRCAGELSEGDKFTLRLVGGSAKCTAESVETEGE